MIYKNFARCLVFFVCMSLGITACMTTDGEPRSKKRKDIRNARLGYVLPVYNFAVDAEYSEVASKMIKDFSALTVAIANKSMQAVQMRPDKDRWRVKDRSGKWRSATNDIQYSHRDAWLALNEKTQRLVSYPLIVPVGYTQTFELFFDGSPDLAGFLEIEYYNAYQKKSFRFTRY
jgi:hypothetical protein